MLLIEDSIYSADLNIRELERAGFAVQHSVVAGRKAMEEALSGGQWDIILCDNSMPGFDAQRAIEVRNRLAGQVPFVVVSEDISKEDIMRVMEEGCSAYLDKKNLNMLGTVVESILTVKRIG
ncbi:MAG: response regulator [Pseudomonadota bacterium]